MRRTGSTPVRATPAGSAAAPLAPGLQLPLEYVASRLQLPVSSLLNLDQSVCEAALPQLLERLQLRHAQSLVAQRVEERHEARMAAKVGSAAAGAAASQQQAAEEAAYRSVFTSLVLKQCAALGYKGVINPNLSSLASDKKLALRLIDFLAKKCFGPPPTPALPAATTTAAQPENDRSSGAPRRASSVTRRPPAAAGEGDVAPVSSARRRAPSADGRAAVPATSSAPGRRDSARSTAPLEPPAHIPSSGRRAAASTRMHAAELDESSMPAEQDESEAALEDSESEHADVPHSEPPTFDGRFADEEFGAAEVSPSAGVAVFASSRSSRRTAAAGPSRSKLASTGSEHTREELLHLLSEERMKHKATAAQLHVQKGLYEQLLREKGEEKLGTRRVTLLKAQNMQLERQLSLLSEGIDTRRSCLHELGTIVSGLENGVRDASLADASSGAGSINVGAKAQRKLSNLEHSIEAAKQRLSKYHRPELQYSADEEQFLQSNAPLSADSIFSGNASHLDLSQVHALESRLAELHETMLQTHAILAPMAAVAPAQMQVEQLLQKGKAAPSSSGRSTAHGIAPVDVSAAPLRLHSLLDSLRDACFQLQSLGVLLPSHTAFRGTHLSPPGSEREWTWLFGLREALKRKNVPAASIDNILRRADQEEAITSLRVSMLERELRFYRETQKAQSAALSSLLSHTDGLVAQFRTSNNALYAEASRELAQCVEDWQRNSTHVNVQRLLALLQSVFPCLQQLLEFRAGGPPRADSSARGGLPALVATFEQQVSNAVAQFDERMRVLREQQEALEKEVAADAQQMQAKPLARPASRLDGDAPASSSRNIASSHGRSGSSQHRGAATVEQELPPFQF